MKTMMLQFQLNIHINHVLKTILKANVFYHLYFLVFLYSNDSVIYILNISEYKLLIYNNNLDAPNEV